MNKVGTMIRAFVCVVAASFPLMAIAGPAPDGDNDGIPDVLDNCSALANATQTCDTDQDGYGNPCDGDFDQSNTVLPSDFTGNFLADFGTGVDGGTGTDMDCSGGVLPSDFTGPFLTQFAQGVPGPSGLPCAGTVPCK